MLSHSLEDNSPVHVDLKKPEIKQNNFISRDGYNSYFIKAENHSGTHVDAPGHFLEDGKLISHYTPAELIFKNPLILDLPKNADELIEIKDIETGNFDNVDAIFFKTGFENFRNENTEKYLTGNPGISPEVINWIRRNYPEIRTVGMDIISMSAYKHPELGKEAHINAFKKSNGLGEPLLLIEDMKLSHIQNMSLEKVMIVPWQINGVDSAPCTVIAKMK